MYPRFILLFFFLGLPLFTFSQISNKRCKWISYTPEAFILDTIPAFPSSVQIVFPADTSLSLEYDINTHEARILGDFTGDSLFICYTIFPYNLKAPLFRRNRALYDSSAYYREENFYRNMLPETREEIFASPGIHKTGNISRGISFGNNQNVFVNSVLNLQMEGKLTDDITITAVISDQNIPFQPEGNTRQIQEIDRVYVQLESKNAMVIAGDVVMQNKPSEFLRYYRNVQGAQGEVKLKKDTVFRSVTGFGGAISKGKFASIQFGYGMQYPLLEGVQGPYRLRGPNNERFIIVLANSEQVYLDGRLLTRGFDYDYVIDYNQAEITFTPNILITKYSRIRVDFEYSDRVYARSILNASHYQEYKKSNFLFNYYAEKDNPRNPLTIDLRDSDKLLLSGIGDDLSRALIPSADTVVYEPGRILYKNIGTAEDPIYEYTTHPDSAFLDVRFSQLDPGMGSYVIASGTVNGRVYRYVGPGNGDYEPVILVPTPKKKQMITVGGGYDLGKHDRVFGELALSHHDVNLFSSLDSEDDHAFAFKVGYLNKGRKISFIRNYKWVGSVDFEMDQRNFEFIDRMRHVDFDRDWSADPAQRAQDHIFNASAGIIKDNLNNVHYRHSRRERGTDVRGYQHHVTFNKSFYRFQVLSNGFLMENQNPLRNSDWRRYFANVYYNSRYLVPGIQYSEDKNIVRDPFGRVIGTAMYFDEMKFYFRNSDTLRTKFYTDHSIRNDQRPFDGLLVRDSRAQTTNAGLNTRLGLANEINLVSTYRYLENLEVDGVKPLNEETVLGRFDLNSDLLKRHIRSELTMTTGTGRELRREFQFIEVGPGQGTHVWTDYNNDGVQDLNEFNEKVYDDRVEYIKIFVPTDEYVRAYNNNFNYRLDVSAPRNWMNSENKFRRFISRFSNTSSWTVNKRITDSDLLNRFVPFINNFADEDVLATQNAVRSALFFNRSNPKYGMDITYFSSDNKQFLTQGFERRDMKEWRYGSRFNIKQIANVKMLAAYGFRANHSDFLKLRNYNIESARISPEASWQPVNTLRFTGTLSYNRKRNILSESPGEEVEIYESGLEVRVNKVSRRTINSNFRYIRIYEDFKGTSLNSPLGYEMLEALQPGNNFTWNINWQERLANGLQLSFIYEGRKSEETKLIHIGRMQVSALF